MRYLNKLALLLLAVCLTNVYSLTYLEALPFSDDMVDNQISPGQSSLARVPGTVPLGSLKYYVKDKEQAQKMKNPVKPSELSLARGQRLFEVNCSACHGKWGDSLQHTPYPAGQMMGAPDLSNSLYHDRTAGSIYGTIHFGNLIMPAVGWKISPKETWDIINYVQDIQKQSANKKDK